MEQPDKITPINNTNAAQQQQQLPRRSRTTLIAFLALMLVAAAVVLRMIAPYLLAVFMGGILALLSYPFYKRLRAKRVRPKIAATVVTFGVVLLVVVPITAFSVVAVKQAIAFGQWIIGDNSVSPSQLLEKVSSWGPVSSIIGDTAQLERQARTWIQGAGKGVTGAILGIASNVPNLLLQLALAMLASFFLLIDGPKFRDWLRDKVPLDTDVRSRVVESFKNTAISVIWATLAAAGVQAVIMLAAFLILGVPAPFLAAGATFIFAWIPILGSVPVWVAGAIYLYTQGAIGKMVIMLAFGMITGIADNFVRPLVLKGRSNMHPLVSLVAIFGGVSMFGITGVFIGPILAAVLISILQIWPAVGRRFGLLPSKIEVETPPKRRTA